jgi:hypothetical protein
MNVWTNPADPVYKQPVRGSPSVDPDIAFCVSSLEVQSDLWYTLAACGDRTARGWGGPVLAKNMVMDDNRFVAENVWFARYRDLVFLGECSIKSSTPPILDWFSTVIISNRH